MTDWDGSAGPAAEDGASPPDTAAAETQGADAWAVDEGPDARADGGDDVEPQAHDAGDGVEPQAAADGPDPEPEPDATPDATPGADPRIAVALSRLDDLGETPAAEHVEVYEDVHAVLQDALAEAARGSEQGQPGGPRQ